MARNANVTFTLPPTDMRLSICRQNRAEHGGKCGMYTSPLVRPACAGLNPPKGEERRRWRQPRSDLVMTANNAEGMGRKRRHRSMAIASLGRRRASRPRRCFVAMTGFGEGCCSCRICAMSTKIAFWPPRCVLTRPSRTIFRGLERASIGGDAIPFPTYLCRPTLRLCR